MDSLIETFHIDVRLILAQAINFAIVIGVLYFFAIKPLLKTMNDRSTKIEKSLMEAKEIESKLAQTDADYKKEIIKARKEAGEILEKANKQAEAKHEQIMTSTKNEIGQLINEEKAQMQVEKQKIIKEIKSDVADLVVASVEKVLEKKMDKQADKELIKKLIK